MSVKKESRMPGEVYGSFFASNVSIYNLKNGFCGRIQVIQGFETAEKRFWNGFLTDFLQTSDSFKCLCI